MANSVKQTSDGGYILVGYCHYSATTGDIFVVKTNSAGLALWTRTISSPGNATIAKDVIVTKDGGYAICGTIDHWQFIPPNIMDYVRGDARLVKLYSSGSVQAIKDYSVAPVNSCVASGIGNSIIQLPDESCVAGGSWFNCSSNEVLLIKTFDIGPMGLKDPGKMEINVFPNPSSENVFFYLGQNVANCALSLFDVGGAEVRRIKAQETDQIAIARDNLPVGMYLYRVTDNLGYTHFGKIVFE